MVNCGQRVPEEVLQRLHSTLASEPNLSRRQLSLRLCQWLNWKSPNGQLQQLRARRALLHLHRQGRLRLPARQRPPPPRRRPPKPTPREPLRMPLSKLRGLELVRVGGRRSRTALLWRQWMAAYHYLGDRTLAGAQIRYLIRCDQGWLGALGFSAAAWHCAPRDRFIGWSETARRAHLQQVVCNSRFLVLPQVRVPHLASNVLALAARQMPLDWQQRYGYRPLLLETYVERARFAGTCYRAANWVHVGSTQGRGRQDRTRQRRLPIKEVFVYPLSRDWRRQLRYEPPQPLPPLPPSCGNEDWAEQEFGTVALGHARLRKRLLVLARDFLARPTAGVPQACGTRAKTKAAYRFFDHPRVTMDQVLQPHYEATARRVAQQETVLAVQDTTSLNYSTHPATEKLGPIGSRQEGLIGLHLHNTMAYTLAGTPLGLIDVQCWARDPKAFGKRHRRHTLSIEQKESVKWLNSFRAVAQLQKRCPPTVLVSVGDREADIYELFVMAQKQAPGPKLLVRAERDRLLAEGQGHLWEHLGQQAAAGGIELHVPRRKKQPARVASLEVRFARVELRPPPRKRRLGPLQLWAVAAQEGGAPKGVEPIEWLLLTTLEVNSLESAVEKLRWYGLRFQIEVFHRTLKSGCRIETRQLGSADRLEACLAIDLVVAWQIGHLVKLGRETPDVPCTVFFEEAQWRVLLVVVGRETSPRSPPSLREAVRMVASLGGFLGRRGDGEPGVQTLWLGWQRLEDLVIGWRAGCAVGSADKKGPVSSDRRYG